MKSGWCIKMQTKLKGPAAIFEQMWRSSEKECAKLRADRAEDQQRLFHYEAEIERLQKELGECQAGFETGTRALVENERLRKIMCDCGKYLDAKSSPRTDNKSNP
jgi:hypothetical protein